MEPEQSRTHSLSNSTRRLALNACDACRQRKTKCDESKPSCGRCARLQLSCSYAETVISKKNLSVIELTAALNRMERKIDTLTERIPETQGSGRTAEATNQFVTSVQPHREDADYFPINMRSPSIPMQTYFVPSNTEFPQHPGELSLSERHSTAPQHLLLWPCSMLKLSEHELNYPVQLEIKQPRLPKTTIPPAFINHQGDDGWISHLSLHQLRQLTQLYFSHFHPPYLLVDEATFHGHHLAAALKNEFRHGIDSALSLLVLSLGAVAAYHTGSKEWAQAGSEDDQTYVGLGLFNLACEVFETVEAADWTSVQCLLLMGHTALDAHQCQLYWVAYLHESQLLAEFDFPPSGLGVYASSVPLPLVPESSQDIHQEYQFFFLAHIAMRRLLNRIHFHLFNRKQDDDHSSHIGSPSVFEPDKLLHTSQSVISELDRQVEEWRACLPATLQFPSYPVSHQGNYNPEPYRPRDTHDRLKGNLMARYFAAKFIIHRPFVYRTLHHDPASPLSEPDKLGARVALDSAVLSVRHSGILHEPMALLLHPINSCRSFFAFAVQVAFLSRAREPYCTALPDDWEVIRLAQERIARDAAPFSPAVARDLEILQRLT
ncbi:hypothetical protein EDB81DRAFT_843979 [Dactylonectria macrodidyma]|uniref:Zn(2)-C6 fungal-type domain-containing protein n=1 Tax=Dactylonectria macrodidyma TaxID=307937 RepID=A0A9P9EMS6_9HYPO|nr:hypothetical protein EDB81DRAFT_843979 [Dactylonectria macrodidyma]